MKEMSLTQMLGHRLLVGLPELKLDSPSVAFIRQFKISNFILMPCNTLDKHQLSSFLEELHALVLEETGYPALIAADQEGGTVTRVPKDATHFPGAMAIASTGNPDNAYRTGLLSGRELAALGINFNLAPVLDINSNPKNPVIGERSYGDTWETATRYGLSMMKGLGEGGVLTCAKHFPGHGDTHVDSHLALPTIEKEMDALEACELIPFAKAISEGVDAIMSSHIRMPALEPENLPNTLSRRVMTGLLRERMGFSGLIVTDCLEMNAISQGVGTARGAVLAAMAGNDLLCICHTRDRMIEALHHLQEAAENGQLDMREMQSSVERIIACKEKARRLSQSAKGQLDWVGNPQHRIAAQDVRKEAISLVHAPLHKPLPALGKKPFFVGCYAFRSTIASSPTDREISFSQWMATRLHGDSLITDINPGEEEIAKAVSMAKSSTCILAASYNGQFQPGQQRLVAALAKLPIPMVHIALRSPYDLSFSPNSLWKLAAFEYSAETFEVLADILSGKWKPTGTLSVQLPR